jgi:hypothetical protein
MEASDLLFAASGWACGDVIAAACRSQFARRRTYELQAMRL